MLSPEEHKRYSRHLILPELGEKGQEKLKRSKVLVIGAGGLGCPVLQYLAAAGVGTIGIVDDDKVDVSNLQRQILFGVGDVGKLKAEAAAALLTRNNNLISVKAFCERLTSQNAIKIISGFDVVVDGSDNFATRYLVNDACVMLNKPLVFGSIFKFEGQVSVFNYKDGPTYRCLYPQPPEEGEVASCSEIGVIGILPGICGTLMANEVIKIICGVGEVFKGRLLSFDALKMNFSTFSFTLNVGNKKIGALADYDLFCGVKNEISASELKSKIEKKEKFQLIDVREEAEYLQKNIGGLLIPLGILTENIGRLSKETDIIVHCASGVRSRKAVQLLKEKGFSRVYNLKNGLLDFA